MDKSFNQRVFFTKDLKQFKLIIGNRHIEETHIKQLCESIEEKNYLRYNPILVTKKLEVVDGQYRLTACKRKGLEVFYVIIDDDEIVNHIGTIQTSKKWRTFDYVNYYALKGNEHYIKLMNLSKKYDVSVSTLASLTGITSKLSHSVRSDIKFGKYVYENEIKLKAVSELSLLIEKENPTFCNRRQIFSSMGKLYDVKKFDIQRLIEQVNAYPNMLKPEYRITEVLNSIVKLYNYHKQNKLHI